ncbi:MAG TPA: NtaA/DmoA family FMN-dependent monooxygenase [Rhodopila sp.]|uniref:NtaA/DmoA family FMN-dependent monooxygenase n=1 Tax=Rhodopila sp. TaxID=2480087 RepID=UPI002CF57736|nr:NtaA/DmoA family FMN-dependent monooxygenase [Rhodopila sp.]HVY14399.1 NtaA/DmoA family FMN-dependent monooxygenase [Rhodopila sp.]
MFHLGWFVGKGYSVHGWNQPYSGTIAEDWMQPDLYIDLARSLERACFDYMLIEDGSFVADAYKGSTEWYLKNAYAVPKADPVPLVPLIAYFTKRLGIIPTVTTAFYPPFLAARLGATLDHLTHGRVGLNIVTAHNDRAAQNYGMDRHYDHDSRYEMADEWLQIANKLWGSWEPGAVVADPETGTFADHTKVHPIHFEGRFYKCRGPLNIPPGPQGRPVIAQAGGSPAGIAFAAKHADTTIAKVRTVAAAKAFRQRMTEQAIKAGRDPKSIKVLFATSIILGDTEDDAREKFARHVAAQHANIETKLGGMAYLSMVDFSKYDLDQPLPQITTNASRMSFESYLSGDGTKTLREMMLDPGSGGLDFIGTADGIAAQMAEAMEEIGGDGILFQDLLTRRKIVEVTDGLVPALKRRGLVRGAYQHEHFRDNLLAF